MFVIQIENFIYFAFVCIVNMTEDLIRALKDNIAKFINSAKIIYVTGDFTSATIIYFKALFAILDLKILENSGKIPKDHTERFRILEQIFPEFYVILDKHYPLYRGTYTSTVSKEECDEVKKDVERLVEKQGTN